MITIYPYNINNVNFNGQSAPESNAVKKQKTHETRRYDLPILGLTAAALGTAAIIICNSVNSIKGKNGNIILNSKQIQTFENEMKNFTSDIKYRKNLLKSLGGKEENYAILRPIVGPDEYKNILKEFSSSDSYYSPGEKLITKEKDGFDLSNIQNLGFRANMHSHTIHSDGQMSVQELLDKSAEYADKVAENLKISEQKAKHAPFTIAITDHDTVEGCKEAVGIISENPWKYRNLRVILGCELSVENKLIPQKLKRPIETHALLHSINPFDEKLNLLLDTKKANRINVIKNIIDESSKILAKIRPDTAEKLKYDDAKRLYPALKHGITHVDLSTKDYVQFRTMFSECFEKNQEIQSLLNNKGIKLSDINYAEPKEKYFKDINDNFGDKYWKKYQKALSKYTSDLLGISEEDASKKINLTTELESFFGEVEKIAAATKPKLELTPAFIDIEEGINLIKQSEYGFIGIAHPGLTNLSQVLENQRESLDAMSDMFRMFKQKGGDKALFAECHYHYYGPVGESTDWLKSIKQYAEKSGLDLSGGLDSHGKSPFYSGK